MTATTVLEVGDRVRDPQGRISYVSAVVDGLAMLATGPSVMPSADPDAPWTCPVSDCERLPAVQVGDVRLTVAKLTPVRVLLLSGGPAFPYAYVESLNVNDELRSWVYLTNLTEAVQ